jgi:hypothetical protein
MNVEDIYTPLEEAKKEIERRWNDEELKKKVEKFLNNDIPDIFKNEPCAVLVRDIITPNNEFRFFMDIASDLNMKTVFVEYSKSKFVAKNLNKYHLCCPHCYEDPVNLINPIIKKNKIVDFNLMEGKPLNEVITKDGQNLIDFHHKILKERYPHIKDEDIFDFYDWFNNHRNVDGYYYLHYLALFLCFGILFDNFIFSNGEKEFTEEKIIPSIKKLTEIFGVKPLIVPATPLEYENNLFWWYYLGKI